MRVLCPASWHQSRWSWSHSSTSLTAYIQPALLGTPHGRTSDLPHKKAKESLWLSSCGLLVAIIWRDGTRAEQRVYSVYISIYIVNYREASRPLLTGWRLGANCPRKNTVDLVWLSSMKYISVKNWWLIPKDWQRLMPTMKSRGLRKPIQKVTSEAGRNPPPSKGSKSPISIYFQANQFPWPSLDLQEVWHTHINGCSAGKCWKCGEV